MGHGYWVGWYVIKWQKKIGYSLWMISYKTPENFLEALQKNKDLYY